MVRPRWHDAVITAAIVAVFAVGVWALWWDDVRAVLHLGPGPADPPSVAPPTNSTGLQT